MTAIKEKTFLKNAWIGGPPNKTSHTRRTDHLLPHQPTVPRKCGTKWTLHLSLGRLSLRDIANKSISYISMDSICKEVGIKKGFVVCTTAINFPLPLLVDYLANIFYPE
jgi:hypothetical protein